MPFLTFGKERIVRLAADHGNYGADIDIAIVTPNASAVVVSASRIRVFFIVIVSLPPVTVFLTALLVGRFANEGRQRARLLVPRSSILQLGG